MTESHYVYILECADKTLYCGYTNNIPKRLSAHNKGKGAKYTRNRLPVKLLTAVPFENKKEALQCEWWFKNKLNRSQKLELIQAGLQDAFSSYIQAHT